MVRLRSNVMSIFAASALVLFMSPVKNAFAQPSSAAAKSFFAQETPNSQGPDQGQKEETQDIQDDLKEGPETDLENEAKEVETAEMNGADKDGAFNEAEIDGDREQDQVEDQHEDTVTPPPAA
jgi:hypothetical protein